MTGLDSFELLRYLTGKAGAGYRIRSGDVVGIGAGRPGEPTPACILVDLAEDRLLLIVPVDEPLLEALEDAVDVWHAGPRADRVTGW